MINRDIVNLNVALFIENHELVRGSLDNSLSISVNRGPESQLTDINLSVRDIRETSVNGVTSDVTVLN